MSEFKPQSEHVNEIAAALAKAQGEMHNASESGDNPFFKSKYARFVDVREATKGPLSKNGIALVQGHLFYEGQLCLLTRLIHSSGQWLASLTPLNPAKTDPQGISGATTYFKRVTLLTMTGIATNEDDDGNTASASHQAPS